MHKTRIMLALTVAIVMSGVASAEGLKEELLGTWEVQAVKMGGQDAPVPKGHLLTFQKDIILAKYPASEGEKDEKTSYELDEATTPVRLTVYKGANRKDVGRMLLVLKGDTLKLYNFNPTLKRFPESTEEKGVVIMTLGRVKE